MLGIGGNILSIVLTAHSLHDCSRCQTIYADNHWDCGPKASQQVKIGSWHSIKQIYIPIHKMIIFFEPYFRDRRFKRGVHAMVNFKMPRKCWNRQTFLPFFVKKILGVKSRQIVKKNRAIKMKMRLRPLARFQNTSKSSLDLFGTFSGVVFLDENLPLLYDNVHVVLRKVRNSRMVETVRKSNLPRNNFRNTWREHFIRRAIMKSS